MRDDVLAMDDQTAVRVLTSIAKHEFGAQEADAHLSAELQQAIADATGLSPDKDLVSDGDIARQALLVLSEDPRLDSIIFSLARDLASRRSFAVEPITTAAIVTALICVLQTRIKFKRDNRGRYSFEFEKKALSDGALKEFIKKFLGWNP